MSGYAAPALLDLARRWAPAANVSEARLRYYVRTGILPPPTVPAPNRAVPAVYAWDAVLTLRVVLALRARGLPLQRYRKGLALLRERWPEHAHRPAVSLVTDGESLVFKEDNGDAVRAWELVSRNGAATGQGIAPAVMITLDLTGLRQDAEDARARYADKRRAVERELHERPRRNAAKLTAARIAAYAARKAVA